MSASTQQCLPATGTVERRFYPRVSPQTPIFVALHDETPGSSLLLNVSENGLLVSAPAALPCNHVARLALPLNGLRKPIHVTVRVAWFSEVTNLAGIQLLDLSEQDRQQIRTWTVVESVIASQPQSNDLPPAVPFFPTAPPSPYAAPVVDHDDPSSAALSTVPVAATFLASRPRLAALVGSRPLRVVLVAAAGFGLTVLLIKAATLTHSASSPETSDEAASASQSTAAPALENSENPAAIPDAQSAPPLSTGDANKTKSSTSRAAEHVTPAQIERAAAPTFAPVAPRVTESAQFASAPIPPSLDGPSETNPTPTPLAALPFRADPPAPKPLIAPVRPSLSLRPAPALQPSAPTVIQMDAPRIQTLEVHLPSGYHSPYVTLPGERVLETPAVTMRIQRSVHLTPAHGWPFNHDKKVVVGELLSRVDPPPAARKPASPAPVRVRATVSPDGRIASINQILGPPELVSAVAKALHEWRYQPTLVDNKPAETQCYITFQFHTPSYRAATR